MSLLDCMHQPLGGGRKVLLNGVWNSLKFSSHTFSSIISPLCNKLQKVTKLSTNLMIKMCFIPSYSAMFGTETRNLIKVIKYRKIS
jgi:hypothetical protein